MKYVSIDIETTGLDPKKNQMIEFAIVVEDTENVLPIDKLPRLRVLIPHEEYNIGPYCLRLHTDSGLFEELAKHLVKELYTEVDSRIKRVDDTTIVVAPYNELIFGGRLSRWLRDNGIEGKVIAAGKNFQGFDLKFIKRYVGSWVRFSHRALDPVTLFTLPTDQSPPSLGKCAERAGVEFSGQGYHTALSDAIMVIELLRKGWSLKETL